MKLKALVGHGQIRTNLKTQLKLAQSFPFNECLTKLGSLSRGAYGCVEDLSPLEIKIISYSLSKQKREAGKARDPNPEKRRPRGRKGPYIFSGKYTRTIMHRISNEDLRNVWKGL